MAQESVPWYIELLAVGACGHELRVVRDYPFGDFSSLFVNLDTSVFYAEFFAPTNISSAQLQVHVRWLSRSWPEERVGQPLGYTGMETCTNYSRMKWWKQIGTRKSTSLTIPAIGYQIWTVWRLKTFHIECYFRSRKFYSLKREVSLSKAL